MPFPRTPGPLDVDHDPTPDQRAGRRHPARWRPLAGRRRPRRRVVLTVLVGVVALAGGYAWWVPNAPSADRPRGDAVVVHAGAESERLELGLELMDRGAAPTLVVMLGDRSRDSRRLCGQSSPFEVVCPSRLEPETTMGEARVVAEMTREREWETVITVTSDYHLRRAVYLDAKCSGVEVVGAGSGAERSLLRTLGTAARELVALPVAWTSSC